MRLTSHVLDVSRGRPAAGVRIRLMRVTGGAADLVAEAVTNEDGRTDAPLVDDRQETPGIYELEFDVGAYFGDDSFLGVVPVRFRLDGTAPVHVPLLITPWSYTTYRGS